MLYFSLHRTPVTMNAFFSAISTPATASVLMAGVLLAIHGAVSQYGMTVSLIAGLGIAGGVYSMGVLLLPRGRRELVSLAAAVLGCLRPHSQTTITVSEAEKVSIA